MTADIEARFRRAATKLLDEPGVTEGTGFGSSPGLKVNGKIFAMLVSSELVVKLSADDIDELVEAGSGRRLQMGKKRPMREWICVPVEQSRRWPGLVRRAYAFVGGAPPAA